MMTQVRRYCSDVSRAAGEALEGSADPVDVWVMLEHRPVWAARALEQNTLDAATAAWFAAIPELLGRRGRKARLQLVRQPEREGSEHTLFVQVASDLARTLYRFKGTLETLRGVDVAGLVAAPEQHRQHRVSAAHYFVCTNGNRDLCCARYGLPVYAALRERLGDRVWQTTHLGGHRFASNVLVLPDAALYGRVAADEIDAFVHACESGGCFPDRLRGRSWRSPPAQAAEALLANTTGRFPNEPAEVHEETDGRWRVVFRTTGWDVRVQEHTRAALGSCGDAEPKPVREWSLIACERTAS